VPEKSSAFLATTFTLYSPSGCLERLKEPLYVAVFGVLFEIGVKDTGLSSTLHGPVMVAITLSMYAHPFEFVTFAVTVTVLFLLVLVLITCMPEVIGSSSGVNCASTNGASAGSERLKLNITPVLMSF